METSALIAFGMLLLVVGAEILVRGASRLAALAGISPLIIGLTIVAFGTSSPELAVSVQSALSGVSDVAVGNAIGSNNLNVLLILGLCAVIAPMQVESQAVRLDIPVMIIASTMLIAFAWNGLLTRFEGIVFFLSLLVYLGWLLKIAKAETRSQTPEHDLHAETLEAGEDSNSSAPSAVVPTALKSAVINFVLAIAGLAILLYGCKLFVDGAVGLARFLGMSELMIGLTVVSIGTSLPELLTTLIASLRGQRDMAIGGILGSNIFNIWCVLGLTAIVSPNGIPVSSDALSFDIPLTLIVAIACLPICLTGFVISRREGIAMLLTYAGYLACVCYRG